MLLIENIITGQICPNSEVFTRSLMVSFVGDLFVDEIIPKTHCFESNYTTINEKCQINVSLNWSFRFRDCFQWKHKYGNVVSILTSNPTCDKSRVQNNLVGTFTLKI